MTPVGVLIPWTPLYCYDWHHQMAAEMEVNGVKPNHHTFLALLNACATAGRVEEAYVPLLYFLTKTCPAVSSKSSFWLFSVGFINLKIFPVLNYHGYKRDIRKLRLLSTHSPVASFRSCGFVLQIWCGAEDGCFWLDPKQFVLWCTYSNSQEPPPCQSRDSTEGRHDILSPCYESHASRSVICRVCIGPANSNLMFCVRYLSSWSSLSVVTHWLMKVKVGRSLRKSWQIL